MHADEAAPIPLPGISRRRFLAVASAVAMAPLVPIADAAVRAAPAARSGPVVVPAGPLSIGYIEGSAQWPSLRALPWGDDGVLALSEVVPATASRAEGPGLIDRTAVITIHGLVPDPQRFSDPTLRSVALDADLHADDPTSIARFFAWTLRTGSAMSASGRSIFRMPVSYGTRLGFDLTVERAGASVRSSRQLGVDARGDVAGLRRGAYLIALDGRVWDRRQALPDREDPAWSRFPSIVVTIDEAPFLG